MKENLQKDVKKFKESGEAYNSTKLAKSHNLGRDILALVLLVIIILILVL